LQNLVFSVCFVDHIPIIWTFHRHKSNNFAQLLSLGANYQNVTRLRAAALKAFRCQGKCTRYMFALCHVMSHDARKTTLWLGDSQQFIGDFVLCLKLESLHAINS